MIQWEYLQITVSHSAGVFGRYQTVIYNEIGKKKYEIDPNILDTTINNLGIQGWELINVTDITTLSSGAQRSGTTAWIFKKPFGTG